MEKPNAASSPLLDTGSRDFESIDSFENDYERSAKFKVQKSWRRWQPVVLQGSIFVLILAIFALIGVSLVRRPTDRECSAQTSVWSPLLDIIEYEEYDFADAFDSQSIYRGPPTPEREDAWITLTHKHAMEIPEDKLVYLNRSSDTNLRHVPADVGTGYTALVEVFHQLHCLNLIRQYTWLQASKYEKPPASLISSEVGNRMHVDHCIETLRIALMCWSDVTPLFLRTDPNAPLGSLADFNSHHKCRKFDQIEDWIDNNWSVA